MRFLLRRQIPVPVGDVMVVDGSDDPGGGQLRRMLNAHGVSAYEGQAFDLTSAAACVVLLLPAVPIVLPDAAHHIVAAVSALSADTALAARFSSRIVVGWHVPHHARTKVAAALDVDEGRMWNGAELVLGTGWRRELQRHHGDQETAVRCRSDQIAKLMHAAGNLSLAGPLVSDLCRDIEVLDPSFLHALCVQVAEHDERRTYHHWIGTASIMAAIQVRMSER